MVEGYIKIIENRVLRKSRISFFSLISIISLIECLVLFLLIEVLLTPQQRIGYPPDSWMYERMADNVLSGHGISLSVSPPFRPTMFKEPLYSLFIALIKLLPHGNINFVIFTQMFLSPLIAILIYFIGKEIFNERISRLSSLLVALFPIYGEMSFVIMPELLFTILLAVTILYLIKAVKYKKWIWFILSGLFLGLASLLRNATLPLFLIYPAAVLMINRKKIDKILILKLAVFIISFSIFTMPWMLRNQQKLGLFSISRRGGEIFAQQAYWAANFSTDEWKAYALYLLSGRLAQKFYPQIIGSNLGEYEYRILLRTDYVESLQQKYKEGQAEKILAQQGIKDARQHPLKFLLLSLITYVQSFKYFESASVIRIKGPYGLSWVLSLGKFMLFILGIVYTFIALRGILHSRKLFDSSLILTTIVYFHIVLTVMGIAPGGLQRHILPITVYYSFFVVIAFDKIRCASY